MQHKIKGIKSANEIKLKRMSIPKRGTSTRQLGRKAVIGEGRPQGNE